MYVWQPLLKCWEDIAMLSSNVFFFFLLLLFFSPKQAEGRLVSLDWTKELARMEGDVCPALILMCYLFDCVD